MIPLGFLCSFAVLCKSRVYYLFDKSKLGCDCPLACRFVQNSRLSRDAEC